MKKLLLLFLLNYSLSAHVNYNITYMSMSGAVPYTIFLCKNNGFLVTLQAQKIMDGLYLETAESISFGSNGTATKIKINTNGHDTICLLAVFFRGLLEFRYKSEIFCPKL